MSWDKLDDTWLRRLNVDVKQRDRDKDPRRRVFHRIFRHGHDPSRFENEEGALLIDTVAADTNMHAATDLLRSEFWALIGPTPPSDAEVQQMFDQLVRRIGLYQATIEEVSVATYGRGRDELSSSWIFALNDTRAVRNSALRIAEIGTLDAIALLCCAFKLAMNRVALPEANAYLHAIPHALTAWKNKWRAVECVIDPLRALVDTRLVRQDFSRLDPKRFDFVVRRRAGATAERQYQSSPTRLGNHEFRAEPRPPIAIMDAPVRAMIQEVQELRHSLIQQIRDEMCKGLHPSSDEFAKQLREADSSFSKCFGLLAIYDPSPGPGDLEVYSKHEGWRLNMEKVEFEKIWLPNGSDDVDSG